MTQIGARGHDAVPIGEVSAPPFARVPDPPTLFLARAARFRQLVPGHELGPYLTFLAAIADAQHTTQGEMPPPVLPAAAELARAREFGMPAFDRRGMPDDEICQETMRVFLGSVAAADMTATARGALDRVTAADDAALIAAARNVLDDSIPFESVAEHVFIAAALQVHAARTASLLDAAALVPVGDGACPACGSAPTSSLVVGWEGAHGARFCSCSLCGTLWNYVRIRCAACGSTKGISYQELENGNEAIKAECCSECRTFLKILNQVKDPALDPVADDVASSALDLLVSETGTRRNGSNPFLLGY